MEKKNCSLERLAEMVEDLNATNSKTDKAAKLANYPECRDLLRYTYDSFRTYGVSLSAIENYKGTACYCTSLTFEQILDMLASRELTGHEALAKVKGYIEAHPKHRDMALCVLDRNLKLRIDEKTINKVFPGCIPTFDVALANKYSDINPDKVNVFDGQWFTSRKLDGLRTVTVIDSAGNCKFYSRTGKEFTSLAKVKAEFDKLKLRSVVFDGEMCVIDPDGRENFSRAQSEISKKDRQVDNPRYKIFDCIPLQDFLDKECATKLSERLAAANRLIPKDAYNLTVTVLEQTVLTQESFERLKAQSERDGWEGLIFRKDGPYRGKRSSDMLKFKKFHDAEYKVVDTEADIIRRIVDGRDTGAVMMSKAVIEHKGTRVGVGSGWSMEQRVAFHKDPRLIIGKTITVQYFEECRDSKTGKPSLRFPTVKHVYDGKRED